MLDWINTRFETNLTEESLNEIKNFTLLWNIYDNLIFNRHFSIQQLEIEIGERDLDYNNFQIIYEYFQNRYISDGHTNELFRNLNFRRNDRGILVKNALIENNSSINIKILAIGIIVYRLRNNLFHGIKDFHYLNGQIENFRNANRFLQAFINLINNTNVQIDRIW
jgi:hypothetical protein